MAEQWFTTGHPRITFENNEVGRLKKEVFEASEEEIDKILKEYEVPSPSELGKAGCYIQNSPRKMVKEKRRKNDIVLVPVGCTENHGDHANSGLDTFMASQIVEGVRRYTAKQGREVSLAFPPLNYGGHPYHHTGMPGTVVIPKEVVEEMLIYMMLGLWNDGFRKIIIINNHGQLWMLESAIQEFQKRFQLPGIFQVLDWHRAVREFFIPIDREDSLETTFVHADESETAVGLLMFEDMIDMSAAVDAWGENFLPEGHFDVSVDPWGRPHRWSEGQGHFGIEFASVPEGVIGTPTKATARKAKRPIAAILKYLTLLNDHILDAFPPGEVPPVEKVTLRTEEEMKPYLLEPQSKGWRPVYDIPHRGPFHKL
ncbi:MAG: 3-dehydro-scyllo-inosose hydrolase [Spirochaetaceae bacterium]